MRKESGALLCTGFIVALLALLAIGTADAAIVPFDGTDYSWLHEDDKGVPTGDWITQINDTVEVRPGDVMQFQNRWYNNYAGTADIRISYGGGFRYTCMGADEYVYYGLNYGNYYPSGTESMPFYSTVTNCSSEEPYYLVANHQYVYNGMMYGCIGPDFKWTMLFQMGNSTNVTETDSPIQEDNAPATVTPEITGPTAITSAPRSTPGFDFGSIILASGAFTFVCMCRRCLRR